MSNKKEDIFDADIELDKMDNNKEIINDLLKKTFGNIDILKRLRFEVSDEGIIYIISNDDNCFTVKSSNECIVLSEIFATLAATLEGIDLSTILLRTSVKEEEEEEQDAN